MPINMDFPQSLMTFLSSIIPFLITFCAELYQQPRSKQEQQPATSSIDIEMPQQPQTLTSQPISPSPSNDHESSELPHFSSPALGEASTPPTPSNLKQQLEPILAAQQHLQWQNAILAFCSSYALGGSLQYSGGTDESNHQLPSPLILLSFLVLVTFTFILFAFFIHRSARQLHKHWRKLPSSLQQLPSAILCRSPYHLNSNMPSGPSFSSPCSLS